MERIYRASHRSLTSKVVTSIKYWMAPNPIFSSPVPSFQHNWIFVSLETLKFGCSLFVQFRIKVFLHVVKILMFGFSKVNTKANAHTKYFKIAESQDTLLWKKSKNIFSTIYICTFSYWISPKSFCSHGSFPFWWNFSEKLLKKTWRGHFQELSWNKSWWSS